MLRMIIIFGLVCVIAWQQGHIDYLSAELNKTPQTPKVHELLKRDGQLLAIMCAK